MKKGGGPVAGRNGQFVGLQAQGLESHRRLLFRIAHGVLRDPSSAEDACQQAMLQFWRQEQALRDLPASPPAALWRIHCRR
jgi:DNA-directed RNA polymerase specialized sigma24 family protein